MLFVLFSDQIMYADQQMLEFCLSTTCIRQTARQSRAQLYICCYTTVPQSTAAVSVRPAHSTIIDIATRPLTAGPRRHWRLSRFAAPNCKHSPSCTASRASTLPAGTVRRALQQLSLNQTIRPRSAARKARDSWLFRCARALLKRSFLCSHPSEEA